MRQTAEAWADYVEGRELAERALREERAAQGEMTAALAAARDALLNLRGAQSRYVEAARKARKLLDRHHAVQAGETARQGTRERRSA